MANTAADHSTNTIFSKPYRGTITDADAWLNITLPAMAGRYTLKLSGAGKQSTDETHDGAVGANYADVVGGVLYELRHRTGPSRSNLATVLSIAGNAGGETWEVTYERY